MSTGPPSVEALEKQLRLLTKRLERSERHRVDLENQHDRDQHLYRRLHADLEGALAQLRATQASLVHAEKMASLGRLTAGIAHEIKNPLNFVNNFAALSGELVGELRAELEAAGDHPVKEALPALAPLLDDLETNAAKVQEHGRRADVIVRGMMEHARSGSQERRSVDLNGLVEGHVRLAADAWASRNASGAVLVERDYGLDVGAVEATPQELGRVVENLVLNALDAVGERAGREAGRAEKATYAPRVAVRTRREGGRVEIAVEDNGIGITEAARSRLFEPFYTTKPTGRGNVGLGLSLSRDVVSAHGGRIEVESEPGVGTTFTVALPLDMPLATDAD